jgi:hypothetical protein
MTAPAVGLSQEPVQSEPVDDTPVDSQVVGAELLAAGQNIPLVQATLVALYGSDFPLAQSQAPTRMEWAGWANTLWNRHAAGVQPRLYLAERNRLFRKGIQWLSAVNGGPWKVPLAPRDQVRAVENVISPALDMRVQILTEQRPGFRAKPAQSDPSAMKKAEAQQAAIEYQYDSQIMPEVIREAAYWAGTDGVAFLETYWDPYAGPWDELPVDPDNSESPTIKTPIGDMRTRVRRIEQVRVSSEANSNLRPHYIVIREQIPAAHAAGLYGATVLENASPASDVASAIMQSSGHFKNGYELPALDQLYRDQATVDRTTVYCEPCEYLPNGLTVVSVGNHAPYVGQLLAGCVPVVRLTDGSTDPAYYPMPIMDGWVDSQMRINMIKSRWIEYVRTHGGGKVMAREGAIVSESIQSGTTTVLTVRDPRPFDDLIRPFQMTPMAGEVKELMTMERKQFEDVSGWTPVVRGELSDDTSGRAILATREQLERIFAPPVHAASLAMTEWAKIQIMFMRWGYTMPRLIGVQGQGRPDLAREIQSQDFDGVAEVFIDPETLMPMPRSLRLFLLNDMVTRGLISQRDYLRRMPFAWIKNMSTPDDDQEARARRCAEAVRQTGNPNALPVIWQDNESIHQDVLERELLLPDDIDPAIKAAANQRWQMLAQQAQQKQAPPPPQPGSPEFLFQQFMSAIQQKIVVATQAELSKVVELQIGVLPPPTAFPGAKPGQAPPQAGSAGNKAPPTPGLKPDPSGGGGAAGPPAIGGDGGQAAQGQGPLGPDSTTERQFDQFAGR